jgi:hypothetical protein
LKRRNTTTFWSFSFRRIYREAVKSVLKTPRQVVCLAHFGYGLDMSKVLLLDSKALEQLLSLTSSAATVRPIEAGGLDENVPKYLSPPAAAAVRHLQRTDRSSEKFC